MFKLFELDGVIVAECSVEAFFRLASDEDRARSLHHVEEVVVVSQLLDQVSVNLVQCLVILVLDGISPIH